MSSGLHQCLIKLSLFFGAFTANDHLVARALTASFLNASWTMTVSYVVPSRMMNISSDHLP
ncbi:hypothetical protein RO3G_12918 [Rhizopus delemar RA 99-880]|uniref:Uncharacterized protein n=1 Tax=Rhizopus delemar (strain RA 99-880 / ATCC MYA-4621 / FGSC 9543 / NRRL 43880) TaxID=246409 RepID=I1CIC7_RHIO9|nr:hypothetical protein RO3G_12918 [Rhizopus delemar RA 99-880]|eukprot:EIE88207.1 hypothetical protein RO3G_12918 [Rhizopus delemar RA 99-880]